MSVRLAFRRVPAVAPRRSASRLCTALRGLVRPLGRELLKYVVLRAPSMRSPHFGGEEMADLAARFLKPNELGGSYLVFCLYRGSAFEQFYLTFRRHWLEVV